MSAPTFETNTQNEGFPLHGRNLPSAVTRRLIVRLAPNPDSMRKLTSQDAATFNRVLHEGTNQHHETSRVIAKDGNYWVDFPYHRPTQAAERLAEILFDHNCQDFADAVLDEARIEPEPDSLNGVPVPAAWERMHNVTRLVGKIMDWKQEQLLHAAFEHDLLFGVAEIEEPSKASIPDLPTLPAISIPGRP